MSAFYKVIIIIFTSVFLGCFQSDDEASSIFKEEADSTSNSSIEEFEVTKKFKIAVIQSDDYPEYYETFSAIIGGLQLMGWVNEVESLKKENYKSNREFINGIQGSDYSEYLELSPQMFFSFRADSENRDKNEFKQIMRKAKANEIDAVILLGTLASGEVLSDPDYKTFTLMDAVSDPIGSGFVDSIEDSGHDFITARLDEQQYIRQVNLFFEVIGFDNLGLIYENSENGRSYAAVDSVEKVADERGFEIIKGHDVMAEPTVEEYKMAYKLYLDAMDRVCPKSDAMFLGISGGLEPDNVPNVVNKLIDYKLPSFTMEGSPAVKKGVMLGVSGKEAGLYNAKKLIKILTGTLPRELNQKFEKIPRISINLKTAELIGYDLPIDIIRSADEVYYSIEGDVNENR